MSQSSILYRLQQIDSPIDQAHARLREIEAELSNDTALSQAQETAQSTGQTLQDTRKLLRKAEESVQDQRIKLEQTENALYGGKVRNPKELQDLQSETGALKRYLSVLEDRQLEAMMAVENAEDEHNQAIEKLAKVQAQTAEQQAGLRGESSQLQKTIERLEIERQAAVSAIPSADLSLYEQLRKTRRGVAVAKVASQACGACGFLLTPALVQAANSPNQLIRCASCGRILYIG